MDYGEDVCLNPRRLRRHALLKRGEAKALKRPPRQKDSKTASFDVTELIFRIFLALACIWLLKIIFI